MTDIIERLQNSLLRGDDPNFRMLRNQDIVEAAGEIKRLTSERNDYEAEGRRHIKTIAELRHENARLLKDYATDSANKRLLSEIERLRGVIRATANESTYNEIAIRKAVSFELAELIVEARHELE